MLNQDKLSNADIALFYNSFYVDTSTGGGGEAYNLKKSLESFGHDVDTFTSVSASAWNAMAQNHDVIAIPDLENNALKLDPGAVVFLKQFVMNGGTLLVFGSDNNTNNSKFINDIFGTNLSESDASGSSNIQSDASGTTFDGGPNTIPPNSATNAIDTSDLPPLAESYYEDFFGDSTVFSFQVGKGQVTYLGWDWYKSFPPDFSGKDGGWQKVLDNSISETDGKTNGAFIKGTKKDDKVTLTKALKGETATEFDDYIKLKKGDDKAKAGDGADMIFGAKGEDKCIGQDGNDWLAGEQDDDILKGGDGMDCFYFNKKLAKAGVDYIKDFSFSDNDLVVLSQKVFSDLSLGSMSTTDFNDHIDINSNGEIEYNGAVFARVKSGVAALMDEEDFVVVA